MRKRRNGRPMAETKKAVKAHVAEREPPKKKKTRRDGVETSMPATELEMRKRQTFIERLYLSGMPATALMRTATEQLGITDNQVRYVLDRVRTTVQQVFEEDRSTNRAAQAARLQSDLGVMRARMAMEPGELKKRGLKRPTWADLIRHERLLASILGTLEPIKVKIDTDVRVRESMVAVVGGMSREDLDAMISQQQELERNANAIVAAE